MSDIIEEVKDTAGDVKKLDKKYIIIGIVGVVLVVLFIKFRKPTAESYSDANSLAPMGGVDPSAIVQPLAEIIGQSNKDIIDALDQSNAGIAAVFEDSSQGIISAIQSGYTQTGATDTPEAEIIYRDMPSSGSSTATSGKAKATTPDGKKVDVDIINGKTQTNLPVGTVVHTGGGDYKITGGTAGNYTSEKVAVTTPKSTTSTPKSSTKKNTSSPTVNVQSNGKAPSGLSVGTTVKTGGGNYKITGVKSDGSYSSVKVS